jgi:dCMP deaminase
MVAGKCPRRVLGMKSGEGIEWCPAGHGEENAILNAARMGVCTKDTSMYMTCGIPCSKCLVKIINAGVSELVVTSFNIYDVTSEYLVENSSLKIRLFDFLKKKN